MPTATVYRQREQAGLCVRCGKPNSSPEFARCFACRQDREVTKEAMRRYWFTRSFGSDLQWMRRLNNANVER